MKFSKFWRDINNSAEKMEHLNQKLTESSFFLVRLGNAQENKDICGANKRRYSADGFDNGVI